jgi:hypothetical protein
MLPEQSEYGTHGSSELTVASCTLQRHIGYVPQAHSLKMYDEPSPWTMGEWPRGQATSEKYSKAFWFVGGMYF